MLVAYSYGLSVPQLDRLLILREEPPASPEVEAACEQRVQRRCAREPLQYILGHAPFRFLELQVGRGVFIPRPETETVVQAGLDWLRQQPECPRVVDLCSGSGAIGLSIVTELPGARVWAVEQSPEALVWGRRNAADVGNQYPDVGERYQLIHGDATDASTLAQLDGEIDAVVTNPPYIPQSQIPDQPEVREHDPATALYGGSDDGLRIPQAIIRRAVSLLRPGGLLVMEHDISQAEALPAYAGQCGFTKLSTGNDLSGRPRYLTALNGDH